MNTKQNLNEIKPSNNIKLLLGSLYPSELRGINKIELRGNTLYITTNTPSRKHGNTRVIPNVTQEQAKEFQQFVESVKNKSIRQIERIIKRAYGLTTRQLRKQLANKILVSTQNLGKVKDTLGHKSPKNVAYYLNPLKLANEIGDENTLKLLEKTEYGLLINLIRLAVRIELKQLLQQNQNKQQYLV